MDMTSNGIGWGATQEYNDYRGNTISVPVGCVVTVSTYSRDYTGNAKFNGTFALLSLKFSDTAAGTSYLRTGSSLPLSNMYFVNSGGGYFAKGGTFIRLS